MARVSASKNLDAIKKQACTDVDADAEQARKKYISIGTGKILEYQETAMQALRLLAAHEAGETINPDDYKFVVADLNARLEAGIQTTLLDVALDIKAKRDLWEQVGTEIKRLCLLAKSRIATATTPAQVEALKKVTWP